VSLRTARGAGALFASALFSVPALAQAGAGPGDVAAGRKIAAAVCQSCHGLNGLPQMPEMPTIAGSDAGYLVKQLEAYRSGARVNELMSAVAPMLDEQKMADAAAYYAAIKLEATPP
jgi:cytochrome c553